MIGVPVILIMIIIFFHVANHLSVLSQFLGKASLRFGRGGKTALHGNGYEMHDVRRAQPFSDAGPMQSLCAV